MFWRYFFAIVGMVAVGILVWRLLQRQERRQRAKGGDARHDEGDPSRSRDD